MYFQEKLGTTVTTCIFKKNCPGGCPCEFFECEEVSPAVTSTTSSTISITEPVVKDAVLVLISIQWYSNVSMVIGFDGW